MSTLPYRETKVNPCREVFRDGLTGWFRGGNNMMRRLVPVVAFVAAGCVGVSPTPQIVYLTPSPVVDGVSPSATAALTPGSSATVAPSVTVASATATAGPTNPTVTGPPGEADVVKGQEKLITWQDRFSDYVEYLVIVELINEGTGWADVPDYDSSYTIFDASGAVVTTDDFSYVYPNRLGPGQTGYLIADGLDDAYEIEDYATLEVDGRYGDADGPDPQALETSNLSLRQDDDDLEVTGQVENVGTVPVASAHAGAIYFDAAGQIIGASWTNLIDDVAVGAKRAFETIGSNHPLRERDVADYVVIASADF